MYYVYQHVDNDGTVVYTGMGSGSRCWSTNGRDSEHKKWMLTKLPSNFDYIIVEEGLTQSQAYAVEHKLLMSGSYRFNKYDALRRPNCKHLISWQQENHWKKVINKDTGAIFNSIKEAAESVKLHGNTIRNAILNKKGQLKAGGYNWGFYDAS